MTIASSRDRKTTWEFIEWVTGKSLLLQSAFEGNMSPTRTVGRLGHRGVRRQVVGEPQGRVTDNCQADQMAEASSGFNHVVCGLLVRSGRVLFVHRSASREWAPDRWDAPGGHIEQGESDLEALARELLEELGVVVASDAARLVARLTGPQFDARIFVVDSWSGEPENRAPEEHDDLAWFGEEQISDLVLADPDLLDVVVAALHYVTGTNA